MNRVIDNYGLGKVTAKSVEVLGEHMLMRYVKTVLAIESMCEEPAASI